MGVDLVLIEQVEGFVHHEHFQQVMSCLPGVLRCGYAVLWKQALDLLDVLPGSRRRILAVLGRRGSCLAARRQPVAWSCDKRSTLGSAQVLFASPPPLLPTKCHLRVFSPAEIGTIHGALRPLRLSQDLKLNMRLLGNSIAVPHAAAALAYGLQAVSHSAVPFAPDVVQLCVGQRMHAGNSVFLRAVA